MVGAAAGQRNFIHGCIFTISFDFTAFFIIKPVGRCGLPGTVERFHLLHYAGIFNFTLLFANCGMPSFEVAPLVGFSSALVAACRYSIPDAVVFHCYFVVPYGRNAIKAC